MIQPWKRMKSKLCGEYAIFRIRQDRSRSPRSGKEHTFYVIESNDWVNVIPVTTEGQVVCIRQYRHGRGTVHLEIPGGLVDRHETPEIAALRELREETGYVSPQLIHLATMEPNPAIQNNQCYVYLALDAEKATEQMLDSGEDIEVVMVDQKEIASLVADGTITSGIMVAAFHYFALFQSGSIQKHPS